VLRFQTQWFCFLVIAACAEASAKEIKQTREEGALFIGAVGCKSSSCHGGAGEKRSQYITWSRQDFHTRALAILLDARSARIAETIGIGEAQSRARCTVCHSPFQSVAPKRLASTAHADEGVSCESCHGAAGSWLRGHTRADWNYAMRVTAGMRDLRSLYVRANTCVACHQNIDNDLLKAGHPTLVFELDSQSVNEPKHWRDDDPWIGPRAWLTGQAVVLRETAWRSRTDSDPAADMQETALALAWLLAKATMVEPALPKISEPAYSDLEPVQKQADELARRAPSWNPNIDSIMAILRALVATDSEFVVTKETSVQRLWYRARRVVLALDRLSAALNQNRGAPLKIDSELNLLREDVRLRENFAPPQFAEHVREFRAALTK
jgi:Cytochrome c554 and c-prime